jgi:hypothetical protein
MYKYDPLKTKPGMPSSPTDLDGLRCLRALNISEPVMKAEDKN